MTTIPEPIASAGKPTELRLALAIRGGVSLAVWMGGACSEIATLRASAPPDEPTGAARRHRRRMRVCSNSPATTR